jgi:hypothetical protein
MNILITGTRHPLVAESVRVIMNAIDANVPMSRYHLLIHGDAKGVDTFVAQQAVEWGWDVCAHPADWTAYGKAAGPMRNQAMLNHHRDINLVLAFPASDSRGTWDMVERAVKARLNVRVYPLP